MLKIPLPRFSLRSLLLLTLFIGSAATLYFHWSPWAIERTFRVPEDSMGGGFSPDGRYVYDLLRVEPNRQKLRIWRAADGVEVTAIEWMRSMEAYNVKFSRDGRWVEWSADQLGLHNSRVYETSTGKPLIAERHAVPVNSPEELAEDFPSSVRAWFPARGTDFVCFNKITQELQIRNNDGLVTKTIRIESADEISTLASGFATLSPDGRWLIGYEKIRDLTNDTEEPSSFTFGIFFVDEKTMLAEYDQKMLLYDLVQKKVVAQFDGHATGISPDGLHCVCSLRYTPTNILYEIKSGRKLATLAQGQQFYPNWGGSRVLCGEWLYDFKTGLTTQIPNAGYLSPDGNVLVTRDSKSTTLCDASGTKVIELGPTRGSTATSFNCFSPDSTRFLVYARNSWQLWQRRRADGLAGLLVLPELWLTLILLPAVLWSFWCDRRMKRGPKAKSLDSPFHILSSPKTSRNV